MIYTKIINTIACISFCPIANIFKKIPNFSYSYYDNTRNKDRYFQVICRLSFIICFFYFQRNADKNIAARIDTRFLVPSMYYSIELILNTTFQDVKMMIAMIYHCYHQKTDSKAYYLFILFLHSLPHVSRVSISDNNSSLVGS